MNIVTAREEVIISVGDCYCYNWDKVIECAIILSAREFMRLEGYKKIAYIEEVVDLDFPDNRSYYRKLVCIKLALERLNAPEETLEEMAFSPDYKVQRKYYGAIKTLFKLRGMMWI